MKKYLYIYKATLIENLGYIFNIIIGFIQFILTIFIFINLWQYIYSDSTQIINGYTLEEMIWYVLLAEVLWYGTRNKILNREINVDIKTGNIAYNINKPYNYVFYIISKNWGEITIKIISFFIIGISLGIIFVGPIEGFNFLSIPFIIISLILGIFINSIIRIGLSVISFWIEDSSPFHWVYDKLILILGTIFPIEMFPEILRPIIKCTPIFVVTYGPIRLIINFTFKEFIKIFIAQLCYLVIVILIVLFLYERGVKKLNVNGG